MEYSKIGEMGKNLKNKQDETNKQENKTERVNTMVSIKPEVCSVLEAK